MSSPAEKPKGHGPDIEATHLEHQQSRPNSFIKMADLTHDAAQATSVEHSMTLWQGLKTYPRAVAWSVLLSSCIVMEGFDTVLIPSLIANPAFQEHYGTLILPDGSHQLTTSWQTALPLSSSVGGIIGLWANGILADRFGYRKTIVASLILVIAFIFIVFFASSLSQLVAGQVLLGLPWGVFQTITVAYASEVCPVALRAYLTTYVNLCWVLGQFIASGVLRAMVNRQDQWSYRIPFALQWMWPLPIIIGVLCAPESPWWLVRKGDLDGARTALMRLTSPRRDLDFDPDATIALIQHTNVMEKTMTAGTSYWDCFRGTNLRRTEIVCCTWAVQVWSGVALMGYSTYFYEQAGLAPDRAFTMTMAQYALGAVGTLLSWALMARFGRRTLYLAGLWCMLVLLMVIGAIGAGIHKSSAGWIVGSLMLVWTMIYDMTVGPVCYSLVSELASTRLRAKTIVIARCLYNAGFIVVGVLTPYMLNPGAWNWGAKTGFFWAGCASLCITWVFFRLPEPKGRTYGELDILFDRQVPARKFSSTVLEASEVSLPEVFQEKLDTDEKEAVVNSNKI